MNEENKGMEINESTLEGVSGGYGFSQDELNRAKLVCGQCRHDATGSCLGGSADILAERYSNIRDYHRCPFYGGPKG